MAQKMGKIDQRCRHVYFRADLEGRVDIKDANWNHFGELRGSRHYCLLPSSAHLGGTTYKWVNPWDNGNLLALDPEEAGFLPQEHDFTQETQEAQESHELQDTQDIQAIEVGDSKKKFCPFVYENLDPETKKAVDDAISHTLATKETKCNSLIFQFCRWLKGVEVFADAPAKMMNSIVREWHRQALPVIGTKSFDVTWTDFAYGWNRVKYPKGEGTLAANVCSIRP